MREAPHVRSSALLAVGLGLWPLLLGAGCGGRVSAAPSPPDIAAATKVRTALPPVIDKVDLLLVVDNSLSMADKQSELGRRMPQLVKTLISPDVDPATGKPRTRSVPDLHVGVITSSLGSHGTSACDPTVTNKHNDDRGHLLPRDGEGSGSGTGWKVDADGAEPTPSPCPTPITASAITWVADASRGPSTFVGAPGAVSTQTAASCVVQSVREDGCGYEETLEAAYHFLADPAPYVSAKVKCTFGVSGDACGSNKIVVAGEDAELLAQRKAFLRPDSILAVVFLTDENDFSLKPASLNWLPWGYGAGQMQRGWSACAAVPDDFEPETPTEYDELHSKYNCYSCFENASDPNCKVPWAKDKLNHDIDGRNQRGFHQIQRFGYNFLWGRSRYVAAFTSPTVMGSDGKLGTNGVFAGGRRTTDMIVVAGIVGVSPHLVQGPDGSPKLLTEADWEKIISPSLAKRDPHMVESIAPRAGLPHYAGDRSIDPAHGGERDVVDGDDLQYACIGKRATDEKSSDCEGPAPEARNPLCGTGGKQPYFKAYPGLRHLRMIHDLGNSGFVASICADKYSLALRAVADRVQLVVEGECLRTPLQIGTPGTDCSVFQSLPADAVAGKTRCEAVGRGLCTPGAAPCRPVGVALPVETPEAAAARLKLPISVGGKDENVVAVADGGNVYVTGSDGTRRLVCEVMELSSPHVSLSEMSSCQHDKDYTPSGGGGFCYTHDPLLMSEACVRSGAAGKLRLLGDVAPRPGTETFALCLPAAVYD